MQGRECAAGLSTNALGIHLSRAADIALAEGCRSTAEMLVSAVYAAFSDNDPLPDGLVVEFLAA